jgi:hypothetical protein
MPSRYANRVVYINNDKQYKNVLKDRGLNQVNQFETPNLRYPNPEEIQGLDLIAHTWTIGDRFYKLAFKYYGDAELWWIVSWYNKTPTESHVQLGDIVYIPLPLDKMLNLLGV